VNDQEMGEQCSGARDREIRAASDRRWAGSDTWLEYSQVSLAGVDSHSLQNTSQGLRLDSGVVFLSLTIRRFRVSR